MTEPLPASMASADRPRRNQAREIRATLRAGPEAEPRDLMQLLLDPEELAFVNSEDRESLTWATGIVCALICKTPELQWRSATPYHEDRILNRIESLLRAAPRPQTSSPARKALSEMASGKDFRQIPWIRHLRELGDKGIRIQESEKESREWLRQIHLSLQRPPKEKGFKKIGDVIPEVMKEFSRPI